MKGVSSAPPVVCSRTGTLISTGFVVVLMSPDFVQRGEPAIIDKYSRARMALMHGADVILEMPLISATGSARAFALGGVKLLDALGCIDALSFGCEAKDPKTLEVAAAALLDEPEPFRTILKDSLAAGKSYPAALEDALASCTDTRGLMLPNTILGIEYIRAIRSIGSNIQVLPVRRHGAGYLDTSVQAEDSMPSALSLRALIRKPAGQRPGGDAAEIFSRCMPADCAALLLDTLRTDGLPDEAIFSAVIHSALIKACRDHSLIRFQDVGRELANRIENTVFDYDGLESYTETLHTRNLTRARVCRALLHILLDITVPKSDEPSYVRLLGMRRSAAPLMHLMQERSRVPIITKAAGARKVLAPEALAAFERDILASGLYGSLLRPCGGSAECGERAEYAEEVKGAADTGRKTKRNGYARSPIII